MFPHFVLFSLYYDGALLQLHINALEILLLIYCGVELF